jgi:hypothetical protein
MSKACSSFTFIDHRWVSSHCCRYHDLGLSTKVGQNKVRCTKNKFKTSCYIKRTKHIPKPSGTCVIELKTFPML